MAESMFAAIWPLKSTKKDDHHIVSVDLIKNYKQMKNHGQNLYKYKPAGATKSSLVFILATGHTEDEVQACLDSGRIKYPNKNLVEPNYKVTTSEEERSNVHESRKELKKGGKLSTTHAIIKSHLAKNRLPENTTHSRSSQNKSRPPAPIKLKTPSVKAPASSQLKQTAAVVAPKKAPVKTATNNSLERALEKTAANASLQSTPEKTAANNTSLESALRSAANAPKPAAAILKSTMSQTDDDIFGRLKTLEQKMTAQQEDHTVLNAKFESYQVDANQNSDKFTKKLASLERSIIKLSSNKQKGDMSKHSSSSLPSTSTGPTFHLATTKLIPLGKGVEVDADIWDTLEQVQSKEDWALAALMSVFGGDSKYYRARKPRGKDPNLKIFPTHPPVILVVKHFYRNWLRAHPFLIDDECAKYELPEDCEEEDWPTLFENETPKDRDNRRKVMMNYLIKKLPALMADKALGLYRQGRRSSGGTGSDDDEVDEDDVDEDDEDEDEELVQLSSGEEGDYGDGELQNIKSEPVDTYSDSSSNELSPTSSQYLRGLASNRNST